MVLYWNRQRVQLSVLYLKPDDSTMPDSVSSLASASQKKNTTVDVKIFVKVLAFMAKSYSQVFIAFEKIMYKRKSRRLLRAGCFTNFW